MISNLIIDLLLQIVEPLTILLIVLLGSSLESSIADAFL